MNDIQYDNGSKNYFFAEDLYKINLKLKIASQPRL